MHDFMAVFSMRTTTEYVRALILSISPSLRIDRCPTIFIWSKRLDTDFSVVLSTVISKT